MAKELGYTKGDLYFLTGGDILSQTRRIKDWKKNNPSFVCPLISVGK